MSIKQLVPLFIIVSLLGACGNREKKPACQTDSDCPDAQECVLKGDTYSCEPPSDPHSDHHEEKNLCPEGKCVRGVCNQTTGECSNSDVCTSDDQCLKNYYCLGQTCQSAGEVCAKLNCTTGICDFTQKTCIDSPHCNKDSDCLAENYCDLSDNTCKLNQCSAQNLECKLGVCAQTDPPQCVNRETCSEAKDCLNGFYCDEGTCKEVDQVCQKCQGSQECTYDGKTSVRCKEAEGECQNSVDCLGTRICDTTTKSCTNAPATCTNDTYEENNRFSEATTFSTKSANDYLNIEATLCGSDKDYYKYSYDTTTFPQHLIAEVTIDPRDIGIGEITLELLDSNETSLTTSKIEVKSDATPKATLQYDIPNGSSGELILLVHSTTELRGPLSYQLVVHTAEEETITSCENATPLQLNSTALGNTAANVSPSKELYNSCGSKSKTTPENLYSFTLTQRSLVELKISDPTIDMTLAIRRECLSPSSELKCITSSLTSPVSLKEPLDAGTYYVVVEGKDEGSEGKFDLYFNALPIVCTPGDQTCAGNELQVCNRDGTATVPFDCGQPLAGPGGTTIGGCNATTNTCNEIIMGDTCELPLLFTGSTQTYTGNFSNYSTNYNPNDTQWGTGPSTCPYAPDRDVIVRVEARKGEAIFATLEGGSFDAVLYILENTCNTPKDSCVAGKSLYTDYRPESLAYTVERDGIYYVVGDGGRPFENNGEEFNLKVELGKAVCTPGALRCTGQSIEQCKPSGFDWEVTRTCTQGCSTDGTKCLTEPNTVCAQATDISNETLVTGYLEDYTTNYRAGQNSCALQVLPGPDATYVIHPAAGDVYDVTFSAANEMFLMVTKDCDDLDNQCLTYAKTDYGRTTPKKIRFRAENTDPIYLIVSSGYVVNSGKFKIEIQKHPRICQPGATRCNADQVTLEYCNQDGTQWIAHTCPTSCTTSGTTSSCDSGDGSICHAPEALTLGSTINGQFTTTQENHFDMDVGTFGTCNFTSGNAPKGPDHFYSVTVPAGDILEVKYSTSTYGTMVYLLDGCTVDSCRMNTSSGMKGTLRFKNDTGAEYQGILVVDRTRTGASATYTLDARTYTPQCSTPGDKIACVGNDLQVCSDTFEHKTVACPYGCDSQSSPVDCKAPKNDTCSDTGIDFSNGFSGTIDLADFSPSFNHGGNRTCESRYGAAAPGKDAIFAVTGTPGHIVTATAKPKDGSDPALYAVSDCNNVAGTCLAGQDGHGEETIKIAIPANGTIYFIVDLASASTTRTKVDVTISAPQAPICTPNAKRCDGNVLYTCDALGLAEASETCPGTCNSALKACDVPPNDTCTANTQSVTNVPILYDGDSRTDNLKYYTDKFRPQANPGSCLSVNTDYAGNDAVYLISGAAGDFVTIKGETIAVDGKRSDIALAAIESLCNPLDTQTARCLKGADARGNFGVETLKVVMPTSGFFYLVVDRTNNQTDEGKFKIDVSMETPNCTPDARECDGNNLKVCKSDGSAWETTACTTSCSQTTYECVKPGNDNCAGATVVTTTTSFDGTLADKTPDYKIDNYTNACLGRSSAAGPDSAYLVQANEGQVVTVSVDDRDGDDTYFALYAVENCHDIASGNACLAGVDTSNKPEVIQFVMPASGQVYVIVDSGSYGGHGKYKVDFTIENPICTPGTKRCDSMGANLETCSRLGNQWEVTTCPSGCSSAMCNQISNNTCATPVEITGAGGVFEGNLTFASNDYHLPDGNRCTNLETNGSDAIYLIKGTAGDVVHVVARALYNVSIYSFTDCSDIVNTCVAGSDRNYEKEEMIDFVIPQSGQIYLAVDSRFGSAYEIGPYSLTVTIEGGGVCTPNSVTCDAQTNIETSCDELGLNQTQKHCASGCDAQTNRCNPDNNDTCTSSGVIDVGTGGTFTGSINDKTATLNALCDNKNGEGRDAFYKVQLQQGQIVDATLKGSFDTVLWLSSDCNGMSCLKIDDKSNGLTEKISYTATAAGTYYIVVDTYNKNIDKGTYTLTVDVRTPACVAGTKTCDTVTGFVSVCKDDGSGYEVHKCAGGCDGTTNECLVATNSTCTTATEILNGTDIQTVHGHSSQFSKDYTYLDASCKVRGSFQANYPGPDAVYKVELQQNDYLSISLDADARTILYITSDCSTLNSANGCHVADQGTSFSLDFTAPSTGTYYIVVDHTTFSPNSSFELIATKNRKNHCTPINATCQNGVLTYCDLSTTHQTTFTCDSQTCAGNGCFDPSGEICADAIPVNNGTYIRSNHNVGIDSFSPTPGNHGACSFPGVTMPQGRNRYYSAELTAGQTLTVSYLSEDNRAAAFILGASCTPSSCLKQTGEGNYGVLTYTAQSNETVYITMDVYSLASYKGYDISFFIQ